MKIVFLFLLVTLSADVWANAFPEKITASVYQFDKAGKKQTYVLAEGYSGIQLLSCAAKGEMSATEPLDSFVLNSCTALLEKNPDAPERMVSAVRQGKMISLHLGGTDQSATRIMSLLGGAKSWLAIFSVNTEKSETVLFTGVGIEVGVGLPRTDTVRLTFRRVRSGLLENEIPLFPVKVL